MVILPTTKLNQYPPHLVLLPSKLFLFVVWVSLIEDIEPLELTGSATPFSYGPFSLW